jgi:hypothetical protein
LASNFKLTLKLEVLSAKNEHVLGIITWSRKLPFEKLFYKNSNMIRMIPFGRRETCPKLGSIGDLGGGGVNIFLFLPLPPLPPLSCGVFSSYFTLSGKHSRPIIISS